MRVKSSRTSSDASEEGRVTPQIFACDGADPVPTFVKHKCGGSRRDRGRMRGLNVRTHQHPVHQLKD